MSELHKSKEKFPKGSYFVLFITFFDRFSSGGFMVILAIYFNQKLNFDTNTATALFHVNECLLYLFSIVGAIIADCYLGIYKTLIFTSILMAISGTIVSITSANFSFLNIRVMSFIGLTVVMVGVGCVKTIHSVLGGNQFKLPKQTALLDYYFSIHYMAINIGHVSGMILIPILREDVKCLGADDCYPLAFGVPTLASIVPLSILLVGKKMFVHVKPAGSNVLVNVIRCIKFAMKKKFLTMSHADRKTHWLDHSVEKFGPNLVSDTKLLLNVLIMYLPLPIYWALMNQNASRWVFQATRMNGDIGWYTIKPDQMIFLVPFLVTICIPLFDHVIFPIMAKFGIKTALQKMCCGMLLASASFVISAYVETQISQKYISILWLFPQYMVAALSEVLLWVANVAFAYTQAPASMKSVITSAVYLSIAGGSLIVFAISGLGIFSSLLYEFLFYVLLMLLDTMVFVYLAKNYKYNDVTEVMINSEEDASERI